jgi:tRNA splicing endonuclease
MIKLIPVPSQNHFARIVTRRTESGRIRTSTRNRDDDFNVAASTDPTSRRTTVYVDLPNFGSVHLTGAQARTLFRVLERHYTNREEI